MFSSKINIFRIIVKMLIGISLMAFIGFFLGYVVMLLWNWLMPSIFGVAEITYWQAWGLFVLSKILFGMGGHHGGCGWHGKYGRHDKYGKEGLFKREMKKDFRKWLLSKEDEDTTSDDFLDKHDGGSSK